MGDNQMNTNTLAAYAEVKIYWAKMCRAMNVDPASNFVIGIPVTAPYYKKYNEAMNRFQRAINAEAGQGPKN
jgi:hypothetical protein